MYHNGSMNRKRLAAGIGLVALLFSVRAADAALTQEQKCRSAVIKFARLYEDKRINAIDKCEQDKLKLELPQATECPDPAASDKIAAALALLKKQIANNCCGKNKACDVSDTGDNQDLPLSTIGWDGYTGLRCSGSTRDGEPCVIDDNCPEGPGGVPAAGTCELQAVCPSVESTQQCDFAISGFDGVGDCLACIGDFSTDQSLRLSYDGLKAPKAFPGLAKPLKTVELCKRELKKASLFYRKKRNFLRVCEDKLAKGVIPGPCPDTDTLAKIAIQEANIVKFIRLKCAGADKTFNTADDLSLDEVGAPISCPNVQVPGGADCGAIGQIQSVEDWADCLLCMNEYKVDCNHSRTVPSGSNPAECNPTCGNGVIDVGETCDDGNVFDGDGCPASCVINPCTPAAGDTIATVSFTASEDVAGTTVYIEYPDGVVRIPGTGNQTSVLDSFTLNTGDSLTPNDLDYAIQVVHFDSSGIPLSLANAYEITFDNCQGAPAATDADFNCRVLSAASDGIAPVEVAGVSCSVDVP